jgi:hypothetical protein
MCPLFRAKAYMMFLMASCVAIHLPPNERDRCMPYVSNPCSHSHMRKLDAKGWIKSKRKCNVDMKVKCVMWNEQIDGVVTPLWGSCEVATHTPENGTWESYGTPENSERDCKGQNTSHWSVHYTVGKFLKCRCLKWPRMSHLDICSTSYGRKKGRESNRQFDSRPLKVRNRPDSGACRWSVTHHWKALEESYNFGLDLVPIWVWGEELWAPKVPGVQTGTISRLHFGSPEKKNHLDVGAVESYREYYMGEGGGFPWVRAVVNQVSPS